MITIDRDSSAALHTQIAEKIRFLIGSNQIRVRDKLPSVRGLASTLSVSVQTVRRAYQDLESSGLVEARSGSGFVVLSPGSLPTSERMEKGAVIMNEALQRLIGLGLDEREIEYLMEEQESLLEASLERFKLVFAGPDEEMARSMAKSLSASFQRVVMGVSFKELSNHSDADLVIAPYAYVRQALSILPRADVRGTHLLLSDEAVDLISRMLENETILVITRSVDAIPPLTYAIKEATRFRGQIVAVSADEADARIGMLIRQSELVLFTESTTRKVAPLLERAVRKTEIGYRIAESSVSRLLSSLPG